MELDIGPLANASSAYAKGLSAIDGNRRMISFAMA